MRSIDMDCKKVETLISNFLENDLNDSQRKEISDHLMQCPKCRRLKEKIEHMRYIYPELEEEVPFLLKNRLYNIFDGDQEEESRDVYLKWIAAAIGTVVLFLNLFYFTNIFPSANKVLHVAVARVEKFVVEAGAFIQTIKESRSGVSVDFGFFKEESGSREKDEKKSSNNKGGKNG